MNGPVQIKNVWWLGVDKTWWLWYLHYYCNSFAILQTKQVQLPLALKKLGNRILYMRKIVLFYLENWRNFIWGQFLVCTCIAFLIFLRQKINLLKKFLDISPSRKTCALEKKFTKSNHKVFSISFYAKIMLTMKTWDEHAVWKFKNFAPLKLKNFLNHTSESL